MKNMPSKKAKDLGFTLIELLIATSVFSVILLVVMFGIINIGRIYYKGINSSNTQSIARSISDEIGQSIQFSGGSIIPSTINPDSTGTFCIGNNKYSFILNRQIQASDEFAIIRESDNTCTGSSLSNAGKYINPIPVAYKSLLGEGYRLSRVEVNYIDDNTYGVLVKVLKGDNDLLEDSTGIKYGDPGFNQATMRCKLGAGSQFCAVSELYTIVNKRL